MEKQNQIISLENEIFQKKIELETLNKEYFEGIFEKTFKGKYFKLRKSKYIPYSGTDETDILAIPLHQNDCNRIVCRVFKRHKNTSRRTYSLRIELESVFIYDLNKMKEISKEQAEKLKSKIIREAETI